MAEPCTLKALLSGREPDELVVPLAASLAGQPVTVTTVLTLTAVYEASPGGRRELARQESFEVDAGSVSWHQIDSNSGLQRQKAARQSGNQRSTRQRSTFNNSANKPNAELSAAKRKRSDERARAGG